jgi:alkylation response protein AidB-like acyl-CoA dehydrogenase
LAAGENPGPEISVDKVLLATTEQAVEDLFRLLDPAGFVLGETERDALHRADWFYARMATIYGGAIEIQRSIIAERVLRLPRAGGR